MKKIAFDQIETILLDMDGTILDKYYDDFFWEIYVPEKFSLKYGIPFQEAQKILFSMYKAEERTLKWTDIDFWARKTGLDIFSLKKEVEDLINPHPDSEEFLKIMNSNGKKIYLVTNAHNKVMELKLNKTGLSKYFDCCITSFDVGFPKEDIKFWMIFKDSYKINPDNTLFIDDTEAVLYTAWLSGIKYPILRSLSSSKAKPKKSDKFPTIKSFEEII
jgi:putative hydrolase of the HAD superfamily